jgi:hypothetical protein
MTRAAAPAACRTQTLITMPAAARGNFQAHNVALGPPGFDDSDPARAKVPALRQAARARALELRRDRLEAPAPGTAELPTR